jgi:hypothetical protein
MPGPKDGDRISDTWGRFFAHWAAATFGCFLREFLPVLHTWIVGTIPAVIDYKHWTAVLGFAALVSLLGGAINSNMPCKPRELLKSLGLGFALDSAKLLLH